MPQDEIAQALGMTRIPVREALLVLELEGRVRIEHNRGAYVVAVTEQSARNIVEVIVMIHGFAARSAIDHWTPAIVSELRSANQRVQAATDAVDLYYAYEAFQDLIVARGLDSRLAAFARRLRRTGPDTLYEQDPSVQVMIKRNAERIFAVISQRDSDIVDTVIRESHDVVFNAVLPFMRDEGVMQD